MTLSKLESRREAPPKRKPYTAPKLTELGKNPVDEGLDVSPELRLALQGIQQSLKGQKPDN